MNADQSHILSFEAIRRQWEALGHPLYRVSLPAGDYPELDAQTIAFLGEIGFPESAAPELDFTDLTEKLFTHTQLYTREDFPPLDEFLVIGATGEGNPVCISKQDGTIVYIDHDHGFEDVFINGSLIRLSYCLARYEAAWAHGEGVERLRDEFHTADPASLATGSFWEVALANLEREREM